MKTFKKQRFYYEGFNRIQLIIKKDINLLDLKRDLKDLYNDVKNYIDYSENDFLKDCMSIYKKGSYIINIDLLYKEA